MVEKHKMSVTTDDRICGPEESLKRAYPSIVVEQQEVSHTLVPVEKSYVDVTTMQLHSGAYPDTSAMQQERSINVRTESNLVV